MHWSGLADGLGRGGLAVALVWIGLGASPAAGESPACKRARVITDELAAAIGAGQIPAEAAGKLETARTLCPQLAAVWDVAFCLAKAKGDTKGVELNRKRGALSGLVRFTCEDREAAVSTMPRAPVGRVRRKRALVVGIGSFRDPRIPTLHYAAKDARDFAEALVRYAGFSPGSVKLLIDQEATRAGILEQLQALITGSHPDDLNVLYFSSHGSPRQDDKGLGGIGYLVTHDTNLDRLWLDSLEYQSFAQKVAMLPARRVVTFLDSCYSGQVRPPGAKQLAVDGGVDEKAARLFTSAEGAYLVTSSTGDQRSWESDQLGNSFFTYYLVESLKERPDATLGEWFGDFAAKVAAKVSGEKGALQNPQIFPKSPAAEIRIGVTPAQAD